MSHPEQNDTKFSRKGGSVYEALCHTKAHPSAETLYQQLREQFPNLSRTTVYTNLHRLREQGNIICVGVVEGAERYDANVSPHPHFFCDRCSAVLDLEGLPEQNELNRMAEERNGVRVLGHELSFHGLCPVCLSAEEQGTQCQIIINNTEEKS